MTIKRHKRGDRVYLAEYKSIRHGKKVESKFVRYLGIEGGQEPTNITRGKTLDRLGHGPSTQAGAVRLLWKLSENLQFRESIDRICGNNSKQERTVGKLLTAWAINRVLDPESATQLDSWAQTTDLPMLMGLPNDAFNKDAFLRALDAICRHEPAIGDIIDHSADISNAIYHRWRESHPCPAGEQESIAYDITSILFFGVSCPIAELGYNPDGDARHQVNMAVIASKLDHVPIQHFVFNGSRQGRGTWKNLLARLQTTDAPKGLLISDRGVIGKDLVKDARHMGWHVLGGIAKTPPVRKMLTKVNVPEIPETVAVASKSAVIYAVKTTMNVLGEKRSVIVYTNPTKGLNERNERNENLSRIVDALEVLSRTTGNISEATLHDNIKGIVGPWSRFIKVAVKRKVTKGSARVSWKYLKRVLDAAYLQDGKYIILCTDEKLSAREVVRTYFSKDFVEKVFRTLKSDIEVEPVRHRLEHRVRAYLFVCILAYWLLATLRRLIEEANIDHNPAEYLDVFMRDLSRVERVEVRLGNEVKTWFLNVTDTVKKGLKKLGEGDLLKEETRLQSLS